ncbi:MAG: hypothetical protein WCG25_01160 [bacterium]
MDDKNCQTLFVIGHTASSLCLSFRLLNSVCQNFRTTPSFTLLITSSLKFLSVSTLSMCISVAFGYSTRESTTFLSIYSSLGHRLVPNNLLNVDTTHEATRFFHSSVSD